MPHRDAHERAAYLRALAGTCSAHLDVQPLALKQINETLDEIADWIEARGDAIGLPEHTVWIHADRGPGIYYVNEEADTIWAVRLDTAPSFTDGDPLAADSRQTAIARALVEVAQRRLAHGYLTDLPPILPRPETVGRD